MKTLIRSIRLLFSEDYLRQYVISTVEKDQELKKAYKEANDLIAEFSN